MIFKTKFLLVAAGLFVLVVGYIYTLKYSTFLNGHLNLFPRFKVCPALTPFDIFHACKYDNSQQYGLGHVTMPTSKNNLNLLSYVKTSSSCSTENRQSNKYINKDYKEHYSIQNITGKIAIATVVGRTNSPRYQDNNPNRDQLVCGLVHQYLSLKEKGKIPFGEGVFDYVVILSDNGTSYEREVLQKFGIIVKVLPLPPEEPYKNDPFERGAMMKVHGISLTDYDRVLLLDGDMFAATSIESHFLIEFAADMVTIVHSSSPIAGNWIILRPNIKTYKIAWEITVQRKFDVATGWNNSGLYTWPSSVELPCDAGYLNNNECQVNSLWIDRCKKYHMVNWIWMGADEVQGIFAWLYHQSGIGTSFFINAFDSNHTKLLNQGSPWWHHYQGSNKPWIMKNRNPESCPEGRFYNAVMWFWDDLFPLLQQKYSISEVCPSFLVAKSLFKNNTGC